MNMLSLLESMQYFDININGMIANIRRQTRAKYHESIKWVKQNETNIKKEKNSRTFN